MSQNLMTIYLNGLYLTTALFFNKVTHHTVSALCEESQLKQWSYDVYTGRHFDEVVLPTTSMDNILEKHAVLIMYGPKCEEYTMRLKRKLRPGGPPSTYLTMTFHDYVTFPRHIWYDLDDEDDLYKRYMTRDDNCFKILFFPIGGRLSNPEEWDGQTDPFTWIVTKVVVTLTIVNHLESVIGVKYWYENPVQLSQSPLIVEKMATGNRTSIQAYAALVLGFYSLQTSRLLYTFLVEPYLNGSTIILTEDMISQFELDPRYFQETYKRTFGEESQVIERLQQMIATLYNHAFVQPLLFQRYTEMGYKKIKIPSDVYEMLINFYNSSLHTRRLEHREDTVRHIINFKEVKTSIVPLSAGVISAVSKLLQPILEGWSQTTLNMTSFYGIREYHRGSKLRNHVDYFETHVISAILMIHQELNRAQPWFLEIIEYNGVRSHVELLPGEMLLYESATLIHGRPTPFQGELFANCYIHYKPANGWNWKYLKQQGVLTNEEGVEERNNVINAPFMLRHEFRRPMDEL